jgi:putative hemolysin
MYMKIVLTLFCLVLAGCAPRISQAGQEVALPDPTSQPGLANLPNPASAHCEQQGHRSEIRTASDGSQSGVCIFTDGSECEEWAYFRGECAPAGQPAPSPQAIQAIDPAEYEGWWNYIHPEYGFSLRLPPDWVVDESSGEEAILEGHLLNIHPRDSSSNLNLRVTFRKPDQADILLWPTGVGSGEFVQQGTLQAAGENARRVQFVCPGGQVNSLWYQGEEQASIQSGGLEFGLIYGFTGVHCQEGYSLGGKDERVGDLIVASLSVPE